MKNVMKFIVLISFVIGLSACGTMGAFFGDASVALGSYIVCETAVREGMSSEDAKQQLGYIVENVGLDRHKAEIGMNWRDASLNKYDKQNIITDYIFDGVGEVTGEYELMRYMKSAKGAQLNYLSSQHDLIDYAHKTHTPLDRQRLQEALNKKNQATADIFYSVILNVDERREQRLQELLPIKQKLIEQGYESWYADDLAGTIIGIQQSTELTDIQKEEMLLAFGFNDYQNIVHAVEIVMNEDVGSVEAGKVDTKIEEEEVSQAEYARLEVERKAAEERKDAVRIVETTVIDNYSFDETTLSDNQKLKLENVTDILNKYSDIKVLIIGHTCNIGYKNINLKKGLKRADACKEFLIEKGINAERISIDSRGETEPLVQNSSKENRAQNRRVAFAME